jgi:hypothetical protein
MTNPRTSDQRLVRRGPQVRRRAAEDTGRCGGFRPAPDAHFPVPTITGNSPHEARIRGVACRYGSTLFPTVHRIDGPHSPHPNRMNGVPEMTTLSQFTVLIERRALVRLLLTASASVAVLAASLAPNLAHANQAQHLVRGQIAKDLASTALARPRVAGSARSAASASCRSSSSATPPTPRWPTSRRKCSAWAARSWFGTAWCAP